MWPALKNQRSRSPLGVVRVASHARSVIDRDAPVFARVGSTTALVHILVPDFSHYTREVRLGAAAETLSEHGKKVPSEQKQTNDNRESSKLLHVHDPFVLLRWVSV